MPNKNQALFDIVKRRKLVYLALDINKRCNYSCWFCSARIKYPSTNTKDSLTANLINILETLWLIQPHIKVVCISGLEPLLNREAIENVKKISRIIPDSTLLGLVTAGKNLSYFAPLITEYVDYVNVSIDGPAKISDRIRGNGSFDSALSGIKSLKEYGMDPARIIPSSVATEDNWMHIPEMHKQLVNEEGLRQFSIRIVEAVHRDVFLSRQSLIKIIEALLNITRKENYQVVVSFSPLSVPNLEETLETVTARKIIDYSLIKRDSLGFFFYSLSPEIYIKLDYTPLIYGMVAKIDANGWILSRMEDFHPEQSKPIGNISTEGIAAINRIADPDSVGMQELKSLTNPFWLSLLSKSMEDRRCPY